MRLLLLNLLLLFAASASAATFYVSTNGNDSADGAAWATAWRTLSKAETSAGNGGVINVGAGVYDEYVYVSGVTNLFWQGCSNATTRAFRIGTASNTISGMRLVGAQNEGNTWDAYVRIEPAAHNTTITNCWIGDAPQVEATNFTFNATTDTIYSPDVDFIAAGFRTNGVIYWGGVSMTNYFYANMAKSGAITGVESNTLYIADGAIDQTETNSSAWSYIYPGSTYRGIRGIIWIVSGGSGATNCLVSGNTFTNLPGCVWDLNGYNHTITGNRVVRNVGNRLVSLKGSNHLITSNWVSDCTLPIYYSSYEFNNLVYHPDGGGFYDFISGFFHTDAYATTWNTNNLIAWNWFENIEQPISSISAGSYKPYYGNWNIVSNVFVGCMRDLQGGVNDFNVSRNTFYRCAYDEGYSAVLAIGSSGITNVAVTNNLFIDCGDHENLSTEGWYSLTYCYGTVSTNGNARAGTEVNGGVIAVRDPENPRGADGLPFTADDGLAPIAGSALASAGALAPTTTLAAHFRPVTGLGWHENTGSNYSPSWQQSAPFNRTTVLRPYTNPPTLGNIPFLTRFEATNSASATWSDTNWIGVRDFLWSFGDGSRSIWTRWPDVSHTWLRTGIVSMTMTVTNSAGTTASTTRRYNIAPISTYTNDVFYVAKTGNDTTGNGSSSTPWLTISKAITNLTAGDYLAVLPGDYSEFIDTGTLSVGSGTQSNLITVVGYNAKLDGVSQEDNWWTWEGVEIVPTNIIGGYMGIEVPYKSGITIRNCYIHDSTTNIGAIRFYASGGVGGTNHSVINCQFYKIDGGNYGTMHAAGVTNATFDANISTHGTGQADFLQFTGSRINLTRNYSFMDGDVGNNHTDFFMSVATDPPTVPTTDILIERNWIENDPTNGTQICSMSTYTNGSLGWTNITIRNNVFYRTYNGMNGLKMDGPKVYNNLFYRIGNGAAIIVTGGDRGSSYGADYRNNVFFQCGTNNGIGVTEGWYQNGLNSWQTNVTFAYVDYNYVCGANYAAKSQGGSDTPYKWAITGQEIHGINGGNPSFTDADGFDFRPATNSILVAGTDLSGTGFTTDFWGNARPATWSIGPFELGASFSQPGQQPQQGYIKRRGNGKLRGNGIIR